VDLRLLFKVASGSRCVLAAQSIARRRCNSGRIAKEAATEFVRLCEANETDAIYEYAKRLDECTDAWRLAFAGVAKLGRVSREIQDAFVSIWIERKTLPLKVGDRRIVSNALRVLMPKCYSGPCLTVFRGAGAHERRRRIYGFSWSTDPAVARKFAEHWAQLPSGGVVLKTLAPPEAVFLIRERVAADGRIFLSEAFTRPKVMKALAKLGFSQSYTYFTWRTGKEELQAYLSEITGFPEREYFRPNFFVNTPDILPFHLQSGEP
jgi:hypothetical protein